MSTVHRRVGAAALALLASLGLALPARADVPTITFSSPDAGQRVEVRDPTITARVTPPPDGGSVAGQIVVTVVRCAPECGGDPVATDRTEATGEAQNVSLPLQLALNGTYRATIQATGRNRIETLTGTGGETRTEARSFHVVAPPAPPTDVKTVVDPATRAVTVTWQATPDPDFLFYVVQRDRGDGTVPVPVGKSTEKVFVDSTTAEAGGQYRYQVVAVRSGAAPDEGIGSDPSALSPESTAAVPDPPGGNPATAAGADGGPASPVAANSPGALATSGKVDLSGLSTLKTQARRLATSPRTVPSPDPGFKGTLPFAPQDQEEGEVEEAELGEMAADAPQFRELGSEDDTQERQRSLAFFAAGLLATVLLMHVLWVKSEVKRVPLEALAPDGRDAGSF